MLDVGLDLKRTATSPYENGGAEILREIIVKNDPEDEIRNGLGLGFDFTRQPAWYIASHCLESLGQSNDLG